MVNHIDPSCQSAFESVLFTGRYPDSCSEIRALVTCDEGSVSPHSA